jgi:hypothetical protein
MVGEEAGEVITSATYALAAGLTVQQLATTWAPFLTMTEALRIRTNATCHTKLTRRRRRPAIHLQGGLELLYPLGV